MSVQEKRHRSSVKLLDTEKMRSDSLSLLNSNGPACGAEGAQHIMNYFQLFLSSNYDDLLKILNSFFVVEDYELNYTDATNASTI